MKKFKKIFTVSEFVKGYKALTTDNIKEKYLKDKLEIASYLPYNLKIVLANNIVKISSYDENKNYSPDSAARHLLYIRTIMDNYTNLRAAPAVGESGNTYLAEYDELVSSGLLEVILKQIPERERAEFEMVLTMKIEDEEQKNTNIYNFFNEKIVNFGEIVKLLLDSYVNIDGGAEDTSVQATDANEE